MTYGCKIMVSLTLCSFFGPPCKYIMPFFGPPCRPIGLWCYRYTCFSDQQFQSNTSCIYQQWSRSKASRLPVTMPLPQIKKRRSSSMPAN